MTSGGLRNTDPFHIEFAKSDEKKLHSVLAEAGVTSPWFAGEMACGQDGKTLKQVVNCDLTPEQFDTLQQAHFTPRLGTRHTSATSSIPLSPRRRPASDAYTLRSEMKVSHPLRLTRRPAP